jgi:hypothetical protein
MLSRSEAAFEAERRHRLLMPPSLAEIKRFREKGVSVDGLCQPELLARAEVAFSLDCAIFDFVADVGGERGVAAFIFLARDDQGEPCDLVAWAPQVKRLAGWYGSATALGAENIYAPRFDPDRALQVHETPLEWLLHDRNGVVVVDAQGAAPLLRLAEPLAVETVEYGQKLRRMLEVRLPRIFVANPDMRRAA